MARGAKITRKCRCGVEFQARVADVNRGWGKFCSKTCKAREQESRTHQNRDYHERIALYNDGACAGHPFQSGYFGHGQE